MNLIVRLALVAALTGAAAGAADAHALQCSGADTMQGMVQRLTDGFAAERHGASIVVGRRETLSAQAFVDLLAGRIDCALFARELFPAERAAYAARFGGTPLVVPIALGSFATLHATHAIAIYVNAANPLARLPMTDLARLFAAGLPDMPAAITRWGQLGATGEWARRPVHLYGMAPFRDSGNPPGIVNFLRQRMLGGRDMRDDVRVVTDWPGLPALAGIVARVASDPEAIGYSGFGFARRGVKALVLCTAPARCYAGTPDSVARGLYPLRRQIYLVFPRQRDGLAAPAARAFARFVLSPAGQRIIANGAEHFLPLPLAALAQAKKEIARGDIPPSPRRQVAALPPYLPQPVRPPAGAAYVRADGKIAVVGYNDMRTMLAALDLLFTAAHPGVQFVLDLKGTRTAPAALATGRSAFAPMGADFEPAALAAYRAQTGAPPLRIRVAHDTDDPWARSSPLAVYVHRDNPLAALSKAQLAQIFSGRVLRWGQLGLKGRWHDAPLHLYGLAASTPLARLFAARIGVKSLVSLRAAGHSRSVVETMRGDAFAIGFADLNQASPTLKPLALSDCTGCRPSRGSRDDIVAGRYLLDRHLLIFLRKQPGVPLDPFVRDYMRLVLSREGQAAIAAASPHYLPLNAGEVARERAKLD